jgi:hypothetical protein
MCHPVIYTGVLPCLRLGARELRALDAQNQKGMRPISFYGAEWGAEVKVGSRA